MKVIYIVGYCMPAKLDISDLVVVASIIEGDIKLSDWANL